MQKHIKFLLPLLIALTSFTGFSQKNTTLLNGKVKSIKNDVSNILIVNLNSKKSTITDSLGGFTIEVKRRDSLQFTAVQYLTKNVFITDTIFNKNLVTINLLDNVINLNEVTVTPYNLTGKIALDIERLGIKPAVTSSSLELPNADIEVMTQSERLLLEADRGKYIRLQTSEDYGKVAQILGYASLSVIINTHKIMNRVSGRTKSFEEMVARDENMELEKEIITKFSKKTMSQNFNIPETSMDAFLTYCMSQKDFTELSKARNTMEIWEYLKAKSIDFKKTGTPNK
ncbi:hypothetical protein [Maribacter sp.]|uniref:hypothetical protein n=1 Tax=Maribacter sp. TaxID=1897614 RepID=UPI0025BD16F5|nr:hypothetical protein [Maribacter sp.]